MRHDAQRVIERFAARQAARKIDTARHKCFISYHAADTDDVVKFLDDFGTEFIAKTVGVTDEDDFINSNDTDYIVDQIRTRYLGDSSVTIVLVGQCTWARRYVDWEIYSSLHNSEHSKVNGLMGIALPSVVNGGPSLPERLSDNVQRDALGYPAGYARWWNYPTTASGLRDIIEDAYNARTLRSDLIKNERACRESSAACP